MAESSLSRHETMTQTETQTTAEPRVKTVSVAVPRPIWETYTYILPEQMCGGKLEGCRVVVPLGGSRVAGVIWGDTEEVPPALLPKLKKILMRLDLHPLLPDSVMKLLKWTSDYYMAPPGMVAQAAFPPGMQGNAVRIVQIGKMSSLWKYAGQSAIVEYTLLKTLVPDRMPLDRILAEEAENGLITSWWKPLKLPPPREISIIEPLIPAAELTTAGQSLKSKAPKQAAILSILAIHGTLPKKELLRCAGAGAPSLERLKQLKIICETAMEVPRDPMLEAVSLENKPRPDLNRFQQEALNTIQSKKQGTFLLHGVTGSGKTEVYLRFIEQIAEQGKGAIVLVPEISLTPLAVSRFNQRFPDRVAVLHSGLSKGERLDTWNMVQRGERTIVIGPRSAVFAPVQNLGTIVVDEEHDHSYKQESIPRYNGRDLAVVRGNIENIPVILGSASPSAESYLNAVQERYMLLTLPDRATKRDLPRVTLIDSNQGKFSLLSDELLRGIGKRTAAGEQCIVLINRRGHSPIQMCLACGHVEKCPACGIAMTYHRQGEMLRCHHCGNWRSARTRCPECGGEQYKRQGPGIQKVQEALNEQLPGTRVIRMDADTTGTKFSHWKIIQQFTKGEGDVLLGTQMVAKGHDFPGVTLAAVIGAEMGLYMPDFRAQERTFNLLLQVAGRAGRGEKAGEVIIQTIDPENPIIRMACSHDYKSFINQELEMRKALGNPPFTRMVRVLWAGQNQNAVKHAAENSCKAELPRECKLLGPSEAAMARIADNWRYSALLKAAKHKTLVTAVESIKQAFLQTKDNSVRMDVDVDPRNMM
jgi:primosomal protein N' (replication factor Y)